MSSTFQVTVRKIANIRPHPNADRLELASVGGLAYQFCVQKDLYTVGQKVVYFPVDSIFPPELIDKLGLYGKDENGDVYRDGAGRITKTMLTGENQNRIHTVILRGEVSQGFVCPADEVFAGYMSVDTETTGLGLKAELTVSPFETYDGQDVTALLGVTKYDAPESLFPGSIAHPMIDAVGVYDLEGADNYPMIVDLLMDQLVVITEKLEGTNHSVVLTEDTRLAVCSRTLELEEIPGEPNTYWDLARSTSFVNLVQTIPAPVFPAACVALRSEMIGPGIQKNIYGLKTAELRCFDIKVGTTYLNAEDWIRIVPWPNRVPVISYGVTLREWLNGRTLQEASNGKSVLADRLREGIVVKPMVEQMVLWPDGYPKRLILKQRSPQYLGKEKH